MLATAIVACTPHPDDAASSSDDALTSTDLASTYWRGDDTGTVAWLDVRPSGAALAYRAERRDPWRIETGTATVDGGDLVLVHGNVTERFKTTTQGSSMKLSGGRAPMTLQKKAREEAQPVGGAAPFHPVSAVRGSDGKVYAISPSLATNQEVTRFASFDPKTAKWTELASVPLLAHGAAMVAGADGRIYLLGGHDDDVQRNYTGALSYVRAYDLRTNAWIMLPPLPEARAFLSAAACPDGRIVVIGGSRGNGLSLGPSTTYFRRPVLYDPRNGTATHGAEAPEALLAPAVAGTAAGLVYVATGIFRGRGDDNRQEGWSESWYGASAYDCRADTWTNLPNVPSGRAGASAIADERGRLFLFGGESVASDGRRTSLDTAEMYDPSARAWTTLGATRASRYAYGTSPPIVMGPGVIWWLNEGTMVPFDPNAGAP